MNLHPVYYDISHLPMLLARLQGNGRWYDTVFVLADAGIPVESIHDFLGDFPLGDIHVLPGGEDVKTLATIEHIWNFLLRVKADRQALLVNLGGGAVCDAGGFAASTFKRGIDFVHVPSTLLAMVDASVGGKTGINLGGVKNVVGTFTQPRAVCIHAPLLQSLPKRQLLSGYAEMIKHGLVANARHLQQVLDAFWEEDNIPLVELIHSSVATKAAIVGRDPLERGERKLLNFGHTVGHALESYFADLPGQEVLHGEAIAAGMLAELYISKRMDYLDVPEDKLAVLLKTLRHLAEPALRFDEGAFPALIKKMENDKKNEGGEIGITQVIRLGEGVWGQLATPGLMRDSLLHLLGK